MIQGTYIAANKECRDVLTALFFFEGHRCNLDAQLFSVGENSIYGVRPDSSIENIKISVCTYSRLYTGNQSSYYLTP